MSRKPDPASVHTEVTVHGLSVRELDAALRAAPKAAVVALRVSRPTLGAPRFSLTLTRVSAAEAAAVMTAVVEHFAQGWSGADLIARERVEQVQKGHTPERDAEQTDSRLVGAALYHLQSWIDMFGGGQIKWPWVLPDGVFPPRRTADERALIKAGALIAAELDRLGAGRG